MYKLLYKDVVDSFHRLPSDKQPLNYLNTWLQSLKCKKCSEYFVEEDFVKKANLTMTGHLKWHEQNVLNHSLFTIRKLSLGPL